MNANIESRFIQTGMRNAHQHHQDRIAINPTAMRKRFVKLPGIESNMKMVLLSRLAA